jgi:hypothetical protein
MIKLAILAVLAIGTPALACPDHDDASAPKTAQKDKAPKADAQRSDKPADKAADKAKEPAKDQKPSGDAAKTKDAAKKPDKVSEK